jgi:hypothetical protein
VNDSEKAGDNEKEDNSERVNDSEKEGNIERAGDGERPDGSEREDNSERVNDGERACDSEWVSKSVSKKGNKDKNENMTFSIFAG